MTGHEYSFTAGVKFFVLEHKGRPVRVNAQYFDDLPVNEEWLAQVVASKFGGVWTVKLEFTPGKAGRRGSYWATITEF